MKTNALLLFFALALTATLWMSSSSGAGAVQGIDRTGGPLSEGYCVNCHSGGSFGTDVNITILAGMDTIAEYEPGATYTLRIEILAEGADGYGFQAVALTESDAAAGAFANPGGGVKVTNLDGIDYAEHSSRSNANTFEIEWTAPEGGSGPVSFYAAGNAVNGNFSISGDQADTTSLTILEAQSTSLRDLSSMLQMNVSPNPASSFIQVQWSVKGLQPEVVRIIGVSGQEIVRQPIIPGQDQVEIPVHSLTRGIYFVQVQSTEGVETKRFLKN